MTGGFTLRLRDVPPTLALRLLGTLDALHREIQVTALDDTDASPIGVADRVALVDDRTRVEAPRNDIGDQAVAARDAGADRVDIAADYPAEDMAPFRSAQAGVLAAHEAAVRGQLLASPMAPDELALWRWVVAEFEVQAEGGTPTPFAPAAEGASEPAAEPAVGPVADPAG